MNFIENVVQDEFCNDLRRPTKVILRELVGTADDRHQHAAINLRGSCVGKVFSEQNYFLF
jgi:hypothetical protein